MVRFSQISTAVMIVALVSQIDQASSIDCGRNASHNSFFGVRRPNDVFVYIDHPKLESHFLRVVSTDVVYPTTWERVNITYIELIDQYTNGKGGCGYLADGGIGRNNVRIHLKSQRGHGLDFIVRIFGLKAYW